MLSAVAYMRICAIGYRGLQILNAHPLQKRFLIVLLATNSEILAGSPEDSNAYCVLVRSTQCNREDASLKEFTHKYEPDRFAVLDDQTFRV